MKVYYSGSFWGHKKYEHAGEEIQVKKDICWGNIDGRIASIFSCSKGMVIDFCFRIPMVAAEAFVNKWNTEHGNKKLADEKLEQIQRENPFHIEFGLEAWINGRKQRVKYTCATTWTPFGDDKDRAIAEELMIHYQCDRSDCWHFVRACFPWKTKKRPKLTSLSLKLVAEQVSYLGEHFVTDSSCDYKKIPFRHPVTGQQFTLHILESEEEVLRQDAFGKGTNLEYPTHYQILSYQVEPYLSQEDFRIQDCSNSDCPRRIKKEISQSEQEDGVVSIGIIGGADGPTSIFIAGKQSDEPERQGAISALYFEKPAQVEWKMVFEVKEKDDLYLEVYEWKNYI